MADNNKDIAKLSSDHTKGFVDRKNNTVLWTFFSPENPAYENAWTDLYYEYIERVKEERYDLFEVIEALHKELANEQKMRTVFLLFKILVPTINPSDLSPLEFLRDSISEIKTHEDYNKLYVFILIAACKLKELEARFMGEKTNLELLLYRNDYEEINILYPLFELIMPRCEMKNKGTNQNGEPIWEVAPQKTIGFSKGYNEIIVPELVNHEKYLLRTINKCIDSMGNRKKVKIEKDRYGKINYKIIELYNKLKIVQERNETESIQRIRDEIISNVFEIDRLKNTYYRRKYNEWKDATLKRISENPIDYYGMTDSSKIKNNFVTVFSSKLMLPTSYVEKIFWTPLTSWPIDVYLRMLSNQEKNEATTTRSAIDEIWTIIPF